MPMFVMSDFIVSSDSCSIIIKQFERALRWIDERKELERKIQELVENGFNIHNLCLGEEFWNCSALHLACEAGNEAAVTILIDSYGAHTDILKGDKEGDTPLHYASYIGPISILKRLLEFVPDVDFSTPYKETPLHWAVYGGSEEKTRLLINKGANVHAVDKTNRGLMHFAIYNVKMLQFAKENSVDVNQVTVYQATPLHLAALEEKVEAVQWLLQNEANTSIEDSNGHTPLHIAALYGLEDIDTFLKLAVTTQDVFRKEVGIPPFFYAYCLVCFKVDMLLEWLEEECDCAHVERLLEEILLRSEWALMPHISRGIAIYAGPNVCRKLHLLIKGTNDQVSNLLLKEGGLLDSIAEIGNTTALHSLFRLTTYRLELTPKMEEAFRISLISNKLEFATAVLKKMKIRPNGDGNQIILLTDDDEVQLPGQLLADWIKNIKSYHLGILEVDDLFAELRRKTGRDHIKKSFVDDEVPLAYLAFHSGKDHIVDFIQQYMPNFVNKRGLKTKRSALHWATFLEKMDIVEKLCKTKGCKADLRDHTGKTPYNYAHKGIRTVLELSFQNVLDPFYKERGLYVDALNGILVGSALISGITFSGFLQPPLGYPDKYDGYVRIGKAEVKAFFLFNSLSFFLGMASTLAAAKGVLPYPEMHIRHVVKRIRRSLIQAAVLLGLSIFLSLVAFSLAGLSVVPPSIRSRLVMIVSISLAGTVSIAFLVRFFWGISVLLPKRFTQMLSKGLQHILRHLEALQSKVPSS